MAKNETPQKRGARTRARNRAAQEAERIRNGTVPVSRHQRSAPRARTVVRGILVRVDSNGREWFSFLDS